MTRVLFLCSRNSSLSQMAEGFATARKRDGIEAVSAGTAHLEPVHPLAIRVMKEAGIDVSGQKSKSVSAVVGTAFDVVITLCDSSASACPAFPGFPQVVHWGLQDPAGAVGNEEAVLSAFRRSRDDVRRLVEDFFERGYMAALTDARCRENSILDSMSDGLIAHDLDRRIFLFNRAAEEITGYKRGDVLGRDCHDVFPGNFCGGKCPFCGSATAPEERREEIDICTRSGERRRVFMTVRPMAGSCRAAAGVLAFFRDMTREFNLARRAGAIEQFSGIIGTDSKMLQVFDLIRDVAGTNMPVLISGESGTGKELVAAAIHNEGMRANRPFVAVNCGALPESLLESELFGHVRGAFTGAVRDKKGRFELADGGTIFLDEIGDISPAMQVKLLRVLQEGRFERVGSEKTIQVDVRIISATNKNLASELSAGRFREDLYYRLNVVPVTLPPLRERRTDIPLLALHILGLVLPDLGRKDVVIADETMDIMMSYAWPGNVRELQNWLRFALVKCKGNVILPEHLPPAAGTRSTTPVASTGRAAGAGAGAASRRALDAETVRAAIRDAGGNKRRAASLLGVSRATLYRFLDKGDSID